MSDLSVQILIEIRDEIRATNQRLDATTERLDARIDTLGDRLDARIDALGDRLTAEVSGLRHDMLASEVRIATRITEQTAATRDLYTLLSTQLELRDRVERCEHDIAALKTRVG